MAPSDVRVRSDEPATEPKVGLLGDIVDELRWTYNGRRGWLLSMAGNLVLALVVVGYSDYDPHVAGDFKIAHVGIAVVLYVLADTITTNQLGADGDRVLASVEGDDSVRRILAIKNLALAALLVPVALLVSVIFRILFGPARMVGYPALFLANALAGWLLGLWLADVYAKRHRSRFLKELRREE